MTGAAWGRLAVGTVAAVAASALYLWLSPRIGGRLGYDLEFDDVAYALDAAQRLDALRYDGLGAFLHTFRAIPPHAVSVTVQAILAFAIGGESDLVLYASNFVILVAAAAMVVAITARNGVAAFALCLVPVLLSPLAFNAIAEYRPDVLLGLLTAAMAWVFVSAGVDERPARARWAGVLLAACLLVKPSFFAHTLALALGLCIMSLVARVRFAPAWYRPLALPLRELALFLGIAVVLSAPYYAVGGKGTFEYFWSNTMGSKGHLWNFAEGLTPMQLYQAWRPHILGLPRMNLLVEMLACLVLLPALAWRGERREALRVAALLCVGVASGAIIIAGRQPSPFFFASFDWLWLVAAIAAYAALDRTVLPRRRRTLHAAFALVLVWLLWQDAREGPVFQMPPEGRHGESLAARAVQAMRRDVMAHTPAGRPLPVPYVFAPGSGPINAMTMQWVGRLEGLQLMSDQVQIVSDLAWLQNLARATDYLVLPDPSREPYDKQLPIGYLQGPLLAWARATPQFELIDDGGPEGKFPVFANRDVTRRFSEPTLPSVVGGAVQHDVGLRGDRHDVPRATFGKYFRACFALLPGHPSAATVRFTPDTSGSADMFLWRTQLADHAPMSAGTPVELHASFTPIAFSTNCLDIYLRGNKDAPVPHATVETFEARALR